MRRIFLSAGHSSKIGVGRDNGAIGNGFTEGVEASELRKIISEELKNLGVVALIDNEDSILADTVRFFKNLTDNKCIVVDIHYNASSPQATGTEVLIPDNPSVFEKDLATELSKVISETLNIKNRGVKTESSSQHKKLGWMRLTGENVLLEICFISNKSDMEKYRENRFLLGEKIAQVIYSFADDCQPVIFEDERIHVVQKGDSLSKIATIYKTTVTKLKSDNKLSSDVIQIGQKLKV